MLKYLFIKRPSQITWYKFSLFKKDSAVSYGNANPHIQKQELLLIYTSIVINKMLSFVIFNFYWHPKDSD